MKTAPKTFKAKKLPSPPPGGYITGKTIDATVGQEITGPLAVVSFCGDQPFKAQAVNLYWEPATAWETGYLFGQKNREVYGRHTYTKSGTYKLSIRVAVSCSDGWFDVAKGESTINVK
jgi:hypothetical protein